MHGITANLSWGDQEQREKRKPFATFSFFLSASPYPSLASSSSPSSSPSSSAFLSPFSSFSPSLSPSLPPSLHLSLSLLFSASISVFLFSFFFTPFWEKNRRAQQVTQSTRRTPFTTSHTSTSSSPAQKKKSIVASQTPCLHVWWVLSGELLAENQVYRGYSICLSWHTNQNATLLKKVISHSYKRAPGGKN